MNIDQQREQAITRLYNTPLPNNPNRTYGQVYSPPELAYLWWQKTTLYVTQKYKQVI